MADADADLTEWTARAAAALSLFFTQRLPPAARSPPGGFNDTAVHAGQEPGSDQATGAS
jgi:hypothetical protein